MNKPQSNQSSAALNYTSYLCLDKILDAQHPRSEQSPEGMEHDEMLFIVIHQVFELWFKQILHEIDFAKEHLTTGDIGKVQHVLKRIRSIVKVMVGQVDIIETMTPIDFSAFRARLDAASGLQSYQFREIEFSLGFKRPSVLDRYTEDSEPYQRLDARLKAPSLWDAFLQFIKLRGYDIPQQLLDTISHGEIESNADVMGIIEKIYHSDYELTELCETLIDLDEGLLEWRYRHIKMVQRTIGMKPGTGGSSGAMYLMASLDKPIFPDLWAVRVNL